MSHRSQQARKRRRGRSQKSKLASVVGVFAIAGLVGILGVAVYVASIASSAPSIDSLKPINNGSTSVVLAANGERLGFIQSDTLRTPVSSSKLPNKLKQATVAIEDRRFYEHDGVDYFGVLRAAAKNLQSGATVEGGSTLTMQLVRNLYISRERTYKRKIREAKLAQELEDRHSKRWILTEYLNVVPYGTVGGQTALGAQAGARMFFNKPASKLRLHEAALLAGLPQAPSRFNPFLAPDAARSRRNDVLDQMARIGSITKGQAERAKQRSLGVKKNRYFTRYRESYFFDYVKQELIDRYGLNAVRKGGLTIKTTIDLDLQRAARKAIAGQLNQPGDPSSAIVSIDPSNGYIRAMASSGSYSDNKFNLAAQGKRQPGSTFKTMVLMAALRRGVNPDSTNYVSKKLDLVDPDYGKIDVATYSDSYGGRMNLTKATLTSDNTVYMQLALDLGPDEVKQTAIDMGIKSKLNGYPAEGLGGLEKGVSPLEMSNSYATLASGGWRNRPIAITKVTFPDGDVDNLGKPRRKKAFTDGATYEATKILEKNIQSGTGTKAIIGCPAAGKTGTTDNFNDAWFVGYTPKLSTSVWVGYPNAQVQMNNVHGISVAGGTFPAAIWHDYMQVAKGKNCNDFPQPKEPLQYEPFFGRYANTGTEDDKDYDSTSTETTEDKKDKTDQGSDGKKNSEAFPSEQYETPPQTAPVDKPADN